MKKTLEKIADIVNNNSKLKGKCFEIVAILHKNLGLDIQSGLLKHNGKYGVHVWNTYEGKIIDVTSHNQIEDNFNCILFDEIYIDNSKPVEYILTKDIPQDYLNFIYKLSVDEARNELKEGYESYLNLDGFILKLERMGNNNMINLIDEDSLKTTEKILYEKS